MRRVSFTGRGALLCALGLASLASCHTEQGWPPASPVESRRTSPEVHSFSFPDDPPPPEARAPAAPLSLTASDGTGLAIAEMTARAVVDGPLAFTEIRLAFQNPEDRTIEGNFQVTLPPGAALSRFAMKIGEVWQEGEVVEKQRARAAYEDFLHRRQDPALLEQGAGNAFTARVFPIPPRARKEIVVSYSQELVGGAPYTLPLAGLPAIGKLDVAASFAGASAPAGELRRAAFTPSSDFTLDAKPPAQGDGLRAGDLVIARVRPLGAPAAPEPLGPTLVLLDTSASRALGFEAELRMVERIARGISEGSGAKTPLVVAGYDQTTEALFEGEAGAFGAGDLRRIRGRQAFGASDLGQALGWAGAQAGARGIKRVVLVTDGVATAGVTEADKLGAAAAGLRGAGVERLDAIAMGGLRDEALLRRLTTAGLPQDGVVADGSQDASLALMKLARATRSGVEVKIEGATWSWPRRLDGVQPGDEVLVYAEVPPGAPVRVTMGGVTGAPLALAEASAPLVRRAWAKAKIASLVEQQGVDGQKPALRKEIVALSTAHRVLSPYTSLLVLETERDYERFGLDRRALTDVLVADGGRVTLTKRTVELPAMKVAGAKAPPAKATGDARASQIARELANLDVQMIGAAAPPGAPAMGAPPPAPPPPPPASAPSARGNMWGQEIGDSFGAGGLGLTGVGEGGGGTGEGIGLGRIGTLGHGASGASGGSGQGFGSGHGRLGGAHRAAPPQVRMGATEVSGRLPPEVIQRIVRQNFGRFRRCYEEGLRNSPNLSGRVSVRFVIEPDGSVKQASNGGSDIPSSATVACVVNALKGLSFPAPAGGRVTVTYPIMFSPGDGSSIPAPAPAPRADAPPSPPSPPPPPPKPPRPTTGRTPGASRR